MVDIDILQTSDYAQHQSGGQGYKQGDERAGSSDRPCIRTGES